MKKKILIGSFLLITSFFAFNALSARDSGLSGPDGVKCKCQRFRGDCKANGGSSYICRTADGDCWNSDRNC